MDTMRSLVCSNHEKLLNFKQSFLFNTEMSREGQNDFGR